MSNLAIKTIIRVPLKTLTGSPILEFSNHNLLIEKIAQDKCKESFKKIFNFYAPKIYSYALSGRLDSSQAKDLVQDVMTTIWTKAHLFKKEKGDGKTWIFTITRNIRFDFYRKFSKEKNLLSSKDVYLYEQMESLEVDVEAQLQQKNLLDLVEKLPEEQKQVVHLIYYNGKTQEEVSKEHDIPLGTVKSRVRLAIKKLNEVMKS